MGGRELWLYRGRTARIHHQTSVQGVWGGGRLVDYGEVATRYCGDPRVSGDEL